MAKQTNVEDAAAGIPQEQEIVAAAAPEGNSTSAPEPTRLEKAEKILRENLYWSLGVGTIPIPIVDLLGIGAVQLRTVKAISEVYGVPFSEHAARNIIAVLVGTVGNGILTRIALASAVKTLPFVGAVVGGVIAMPVIAGASTYAVGRVFINHFENGGNLLNVDTQKVKEYFNTQVEAGKKLTSDLLKRKKDSATEAPAANAEAATVA